MQYKILNDPIYGLIEIPTGLILNLIEHPIFQRLRRVNQLGLTHYVYPSATHTRFSHSIGAMHLTTQAIQILRNKGVNITKEEAESVTIAILLHDIGHGPFSHSLEYHILAVHHEKLSLLFMQELNETFNGQLELAIQIFKNQYHKKFLYQLVSGQLDMDRMDYLNRDSFFTGVVDGRVSWDRLLKTLDVHEDNLVVEFKGIYSVENFLIARRLMYWQVYLHKNVICAGEMLIKTIKRAKELSLMGQNLGVSDSLHYFFSNNFSTDVLQKNTSIIQHHFYNIDDIDILSALKIFSNCEDFILSHLAQCLVKRKLFKIDLRNNPISEKFLETTRKKVLNKYKQLDDTTINYLVLEGKEANSAYKKDLTEIKIKLKDNTAKPISEWKEHNIQEKKITKFFACYPQNL